MSQPDSAPHMPCWKSLRQQHPNNSKQHGALAKISNLLFCSRLGWKPSISNRVPRDPAVPLHLQKRCCLLKLRQFWQKRSLQQSHFRAVTHWLLGLQEWSSPQLRWKLASNKSRLWSTCVMRRASCFEQLARFHTAKNGIATHYRFSLWKGPFLRVGLCRPEFSIRWKNDSIFKTGWILWGKSFDFMTPADSVRRLEMQNFGFTTVLCQFWCPVAESCRSRVESWNLTMGKALKEFQLCDSRRLRKKAQDAQDDVIKLFDLFHPVFGVGKVIEFGLLKAVLSSSAHGCLCHPSCLSWCHCFWWTFRTAEAFRASCRNPKNRVATLQRVDSIVWWLEKHYWADSKRALWAALPLHHVSH